MLWVNHVYIMNIAQISPHEYCITISSIIALKILRAVSAGEILINCCTWNISCTFVPALSLFNKSLLYCLQFHITLSWCSSCSGSACGDSPRLPVGSLLAYKWPTCWCRSYMLMLIGDSGGKKRTWPARKSGTSILSSFPHLASVLSSENLKGPTC